jgi:hypothetical protein
MTITADAMTSPVQAMSSTADTMALIAQAKPLYDKERASILLSRQSDIKTILITVEASPSKQRALQAMPPAFKPHQ